MPRSVVDSGNPPQETFRKHCRGTGNGRVKKKIKIQIAVRCLAAWTHPLIHLRSTVMTWLGSACWVWIKAAPAGPVLPARAWASSGVLNSLALPWVLGLGSGLCRRGKKGLWLGACPAARKMRAGLASGLGFWWCYRVSLPLWKRNQVAYLWKWRAQLPSKAFTPQPLSAVLTCR